MEEQRQKLILIAIKLNKLDSEKREYISGWLDAKVEKKEGAS